MSDSPTIAIVGGRGGMGALLDRILTAQGHRVLVADLETDLTGPQAAAMADVTIISVPIDRTREVIAQVGPSVPPHGLLMDICSLKGPPLKAMLDSTDAHVIGTHPMFGPTTSLSGQVVVTCPARPGPWLAWLRRIWTHEGAVLIECDPDEHDRMMAVIQVLRHFATIVFGRTLADLDVDLERTVSFSSPIYRLELMMTSRLFAQDPSLYADIEMLNPHRDTVISAFEAATASLADMVRHGRRDDFIESFREIASFFGPDRQQAMRASERVLAALTNPES